ncbi:hypothetical protein CHS0354_037494 [Potamilus streckersoni]|uniref:Uncharacterized protein n=1 Tax=Potamilus streckersoni TaxID=2493646 RepID=A0AAE0RPI9_9BIVA|nr:hypothetical protein CHS0354_037494 [Potamilus streckersoni]
MEDGKGWVESSLQWQTIEKFARRGRSLEIFIKNKSRYMFKLEEDFLDSGERFRTIFKDCIYPGSSWLTLVANKAPSFSLSVGGGLKYRLHCPYCKENDCDDCKRCILYIGFGNPFIGNLVSFVSLTNVEHPAKYAFDEAKDGTFKSSSFGGLRGVVEMIDAIYCSSKRIVFSVE